MPMRLLGWFFLLIQSGTGTWELEVGEITLSGAVTSQTFNFASTFLSTPVVFLTPSMEGPDAADIRVWNVGTSSFEAVIVEPRGDSHLAMTVGYIAAVPGVQFLPDGRAMEVGIISTIATQRDPSCVSAPAPSPSWESLSFSYPFTSPPVLLAQLQSSNNGQPAPSATFLVPAARTLTAASVELALDMCGTGNYGSVNHAEDIAYLLMEPGLGSFTASDTGTNVEYAAVVSGAVVEGWDDGDTSVAFGRTFATKPLVVASLTSRNEDDGGWLRWDLGNSDVSHVSLRKDEDISTCDSERSSVAESVGIVAWSAAFRTTNEGTTTITSTSTTTISTTSTSTSTISTTSTSTSTATTTSSSSSSTSTTSTITSTATTTTSSTTSSSSTSISSSSTTSSSTMSTTSSSSSSSTSTSSSSTTSSSTMSTTSSSSSSSTSTSSSSTTSSSTMSTTSSSSSSSTSTSSSSTTSSSTMSTTSSSSSSSSSSTSTSTSSTTSASSTSSSTSTTSYSSTSTSSSSTTSTTTTTTSRTTTTSSTTSSSSSSTSSSSSSTTTSTGTATSTSSTSTSTGTATSTSSTSSSTTSSSTTTNSATSTTTSSSSTNTSSTTTSLSTTTSSTSSSTTATTTSSTRSTTSSSTSTATTATSTTTLVCPAPAFEGADPASCEEIVHGHSCSLTCRSGYKVVESTLLCIEGALTTASGATPQCLAEPWLGIPDDIKFLSGGLFMGLLCCCTCTCVLRRICRPKSVGSRPLLDKPDHSFSYKVEYPKDGQGTDKKVRVIWDVNYDDFQDLFATQVEANEDQTEELPIAATPSPLPAPTVPMYQSGELVEYFSVTHQRWLTGAIKVRQLETGLPSQLQGEGQRETPSQEQAQAQMQMQKSEDTKAAAAAADPTRGSAYVYAVHFEQSRVVRNGISPTFLRRPFMEQDPVEIFSQRCDAWLPARIEARPHVGSKLLGPRHYVRLLRAGEALGALVAGVPSESLRPRFPVGSTVEVFRGVEVGWAPALVVDPLQSVAADTSDSAAEQDKEQVLRPGQGQGRGQGQGQGGSESDSRSDPGLDSDFELDLPVVHVVDPEGPANMQNSNSNSVAAPVAFPGYLVRPCRAVQEADSDLTSIIVVE